VFPLYLTGWLSPVNGFPPFKLLVFGDSSEFRSSPVTGADTSACVNARAAFVWFRMFFVRRVFATYAPMRRWDSITACVITHAWF
jgi:hypothetical protein